MLTLLKQTQLQEKNQQLESELRESEQRRNTAELERDTVERQRGEAEQEITYLKRQIEALKRKIFGAARSEQISDAQMQLALAELQKEASEQEQVPAEVISYHRRKPRSEEPMARLPEDMEVVTEEIIPEEVQAAPENYERIGEEVTEELDVVPMKFIKRRIVRPKFKHRGQPDAVPFVAALPARVVPGGLPAAGLIAHLIVAKYVDHLPLYRLEKAFAQRFGVKLPRQRMCDWIGYAVENWLAQIYHSIRQGLIAGDYLQIDETPIRYLDPDRQGKSHRGYLWVYGRPGGDVCFDWQLGRGKAAATPIVQDFSGLLQSDGYAVYDAVCRERSMTQLGCWAHARRKFYEAYPHGESGAGHYLILIRELYAIEAELPESPEQVVRLRRAKSAPVLARIKAALDQDVDRHLAKSAMAQAVGYTRNQWDKLNTYVDHGQTRIDNNLTEQAIRPTKLGAKNWLFIGHPEAGKRSAMIYTILECCRRHRVEPLAYLNDVLRRLPGMTNHQAQAARLTPSEWGRQP